MWHWIIAIAETSREIVTKYDSLLNMNLISNLGKFRAIQLWVWPSKVSFTTVVPTEKEFQRRFQNIFDFTLLFFQALLKRRKNNKLKLDESSLLRVFYYILQYTIIPSLTERFEIMVIATLRKNLRPTILKQNHDSCLQEDQELWATCTFFSEFKGK